MKTMLIGIVLIGSMLNSLTQERFSLELKLVKPTGKIDSTSYFQCTLMNLTDTAFLIFSGNFITPHGPQKCYFTQEVVYEDGNVEISAEFDGFRFEEDGCEVWMKKLEAGQSVTTLIPMFCDARGNGAFPYDEEYIKVVKRFRIRLEKFQYENLGKLESVKGETLLSNWVEVDTDAVIALLRKELKR